MFSLLAASNNKSFFLLVFGLSVTIGLTSNKRHAQFGVTVVPQSCELFLDIQVVSSCLVLKLPLWSCH